MDVLERYGRQLAAVIQRAIPDFVWCGDPYDIASDSVPLPACTIDVTEFSRAEPDDDGPGLQLRVQLHVLVDPAQGGAGHQARDLARRVALELDQCSVPGLCTRPAEFVQASEAAFHPRLESYLAWLVEIQQELRINLE